MWIPTLWGPTDIFPSSSRHEMQTAVPPTRLHAFTTKNSATSTFTDVKVCKLTIEGLVSYIRHWMFSSRSGCFTRGKRAAGSHWAEGGKVAELVRTWRLKERSLPVAHPQPVSQFTKWSYRIKMPTDQIRKVAENKNLTTRMKWRFPSYGVIKFNGSFLLVTWNLNPIKLTTSTHFNRN
jgi:hypothetical protein